MSVKLRAVSGGNDYDITQWECSGCHGFIASPDSAEKIEDWPPDSCPHCGEEIET